MAMKSSAPAKDISAVPNILQRVIEDDVDLSLLIHNLRLTPTQRVQRAQRMLDSVLALQHESRQSHERRWSPK